MTEINSFVPTEDGFLPAEFFVYLKETTGMIVEEYRALNELLQHELQLDYYEYLDQLAESESEEE